MAAMHPVVFLKKKQIKKILDDIQVTTTSNICTKYNIQIGRFNSEMGRRAVEANHFTSSEARKQSVSTFVHFDIHLRSGEKSHRFRVHDTCYRECQAEAKRTFANRQNNSQYDWIIIWSIQFETGQTAEKRVELEIFSR